MGFNLADINVGQKLSEAFANPFSGSFFNRENVELPGPKVFNSPRGDKAAGWIEDAYNLPYSAPTLKVAGMSDNEKAGQSALADIMAGKAFQDPTTSPLYKSLRDEMDAQTQQGVNELWQRSQLGGMLRGSGP